MIEVLGKGVPSILHPLTFPVNITYGICQKLAGGGG